MTVTLCRSAALKRCLVMLVTGFLKFTLFPTLRSNACRFASAQEKYADQNGHTFRYSTTRPVRVYGFGVAATGALGIRRYVEPKRESVLYLSL